MARPPESGERIMVFKGHWLLRVLLKEKTLEIRGVRYAGKYLLGCRGKIFARATFGEPFRIADVEQWRQLRSAHRVSGNELPYKKTWALPVQELICFRQPYIYKPRWGAVGIAVYRRDEEDLAALGVRERRSCLNLGGEKCTRAALRSRPPHPPHPN